jgi:hypothetical protein
MIGQHPELVGLPELKLFTYRTIGALEASLPQYWIERGLSHRSPGLVRALAQFQWGEQTPASLARTRNWLSQHGHWSGAHVFDVLLEAVSPRCAVEKSPENVATAGALRRLASAYPNARYLHLTRHPITTQASMAAHLLRTVPEHVRLGEPMAGIAAWHEIHTRILKFTAPLPTARVMRVRAEDVLNDSRPYLRAIAAWLGLRTDDSAIEAMRHPEASPFARLGPPGTGIIGGHDHGFLRDPIPRSVGLPPTIERPAGWCAEHRLWQRVLVLGRHLGYGDMTGQPGGSRKSAHLPADLLRGELLRRAAADRAARSLYTGRAEEMARLMEMDSDNTAWLASVIDQVGWPGQTLVGTDGAHATWLLAQHGDLKPGFQRRCLELMRQAVKHGEASAADCAYLTDRVLLARGEPQLYGTQGSVQASQYAPAPLRDPQAVDTRRAAVGLQPIAAQPIPATDRQQSRSLVCRPCPACGELVKVAWPWPGRIARFSCRACGATGTVRTKSRGSLPPA